MRRAPLLELGGGHTGEFFKLARQMLGAAVSQVEGDVIQRKLIVHEVLFRFFHFLKQALGTQSQPPAQLLVGLALFLTLFLMSPVLDEVAADYAGRLKIVKVDVDQCQKTAMNYSIRGVPTMILFKNGQVQDTQVGAVPKGKVTAMVDKVL